MIKRYVKTAKDISIGSVELVKGVFLEIIAEIKSTKFTSGLAITIKTLEDDVISFDASFFE